MVEDKRLRKKTCLLHGMYFPTKRVKQLKFLYYESYLYLAQIINCVYGFSFPLHRWTEYLLSMVNL